MKKSTIILVALTVVTAVGLLAINSGLGKVKSYYSGDAIYHNGQTLIISTNTGKLEIFTPKGKELSRLTVIKPGNSGFDTFSAAIFFQQNDRLYVYAASGSTLYKFDAENPANLNLIGSTKDTTWDWIGRLERNNGRLISIGSKGVKVWNDELQVIDSFNVINSTNPYNVRLSADGTMIFNITGNLLQVFDRQTRTYFRNIVLDSKHDSGNRQLFFDDPADMIYVIDDAGIKRYGLDGSLYKTLRHDSKFGYDIVANSNQSQIYVSNGTSIAKLNKADFTFTAGYENYFDKSTNNWSMGLTLVNTPNGQQVVAFNNGRIILLTENLKLLAGAYSLDDVIEKESALEELSLSLDKNHAAPWSQVSVRGQGYFANEKLTLLFGDVKYETFADARGRFTKLVYVPATKLDRTDIKVTGEISKLSYSISFKIEQPIK